MQWKGEPDRLLVDLWAKFPNRPTLIYDELIRLGYDVTLDATKKRLERLHKQGEIDTPHHTLSNNFPNYTPIHKNTKSVVLISGDRHAPFHHTEYLNFLVDTYAKYGCNTFVDIGDEADMHCTSRWPREHDSMGAVEEYNLMIDYMKKVYGAFPDANVCISNHTARPIKVANRVGLISAFLKDYHEFMQAPAGWIWRDSFLIDEVLYTHGESWGGGYAFANAAKDNGISTVMGHLHSVAGVKYIKGPAGRQIFGLATGCGIDEEAYAFRYGKFARRRPILGCGVVIRGREAHFVPMG